MRKYGTEIWVPLGENASQTGNGKEGRFIGRASRKDRVSILSKVFSSSLRKPKFLRNLWPLEKKIDHVIWCAVFRFTLACIANKVLRLRWRWQVFLLEITSLNLNIGRFCPAKSRPKVRHRTLSGFCTGKWEGKELRAINGLFAPEKRWCHAVPSKVFIFPFKRSTVHWVRSRYPSAIFLNGLVEKGQLQGIWLLPSS